MWCFKMVWNYLCAKHINYMSKKKIYRRDFKKYSSFLHNDSSPLFFGHTIDQGVFFSDTESEKCLTPTSFFVTPTFRFFKILPRLRYPDFSIFQKFTPTPLPRLAICRGKVCREKNTLIGCQKNPGNRGSTWHFSWSLNFLIFSLLGCGCPQILVLSLRKRLEKKKEKCSWMWTYEM